MDYSGKSQMTIGKKLFLSIGATLALVIAIAGVAMYTINAIGNSLQKVSQTEARKLYLAGSIDARMSEIIAEERGIIGQAFLSDKAMEERYNRDFQASSARLVKDLEEVSPLVETAEGRGIIAELQSSSSQLTQLHQELYRLAATDDSLGASQLLAQKVMPLAAKASQLAGQLVKIEVDRMAAQSAAAARTVWQSHWLTVIFTILSILLCGVSLYIVRQINRSLRQAVTRLSDNTQQLASAAAQVSSTSQSLAQGSSEQAASIEETSASTEEIHSMARKNTDNSRSTAELVSQSQQKYAETNQSLEEMVVAMDEINQSSDKISKIIKVIDEIAFQTNILALNAAVEAARAGEAGMGFAVVADEVRSLAQRSAQAAKDTASLIEESIGQSRGGKVKVDKVAAAIRAITAESSKIKSLVDEISTGSEEQARGLDQIGRAMSQMQQVTQMTAANAEESASAAEELNAQSDALREICARLTGMVGEDGSDAMQQAEASPRVTGPRGNGSGTQRNYGSQESSGSKAGARVQSPFAPALKPSFKPSLPTTFQPWNDQKGLTDASGFHVDRSSFPLEEEFKEF